MSIAEAFGIPVAAMYGAKDCTDCTALYDGVGGHCMSRPSRIPGSLSITQVKKVVGGCGDERAT